MFINQHKFPLKYIISFLIMYSFYIITKFFSVVHIIYCHIIDNCKVIIIGHDKQCDLVKNPERSGFVKYLEAFRLANDPRAQICELKKNYRGWFSTFCDEVKI